MVGVQCKSCGHRALIKPEPFKMDHEVVTELRRSNVKCSQCGGNEYSVITLSSNLADLADQWLTGGASALSAKPMIEGDKQG